MYGFDAAIETSKLRLLPRAGIGEDDPAAVHGAGGGGGGGGGDSGAPLQDSAPQFVVLGLDRLKRGRSTVMVKTLAATAVVVLASSIYSMAEIRLRFAELGDPTPTDQILMSRHLLEASLLGMGIFFNLDASCSAIKSYYHSTHVAGYSLFLALIIDRLHLYIRELHGLRNSSMEAVMKQNWVTGKPKTGSS
ncbi:hypothetical protein B296_00015983 [Ensete ventricosum]|uniref:Endoplasmic reticulum transmembrane protein n=1 Tax=Ensete ventricosum TaxID=4639 RepID=A0A426ZR83_ENSVE|nr:hypothetical protein B296_00015983 [Ensete ventricosum]